LTLAGQQRIIIYTLGMLMTPIIKTLAAQAGLTAQASEVEKFTNLVLEYSIGLLDSHAHQLRKYNFYTNAVTAETCAGILREYLKQGTLDENRSME